MASLVALFQLLSKLLKEGRIDEAEYLDSILNTQKYFQNSYQDGIP